MQKKRQNPLVQHKKNKICNFRALFRICMKPSKFFKLYRCVYSITIRKIPYLILSFFFFNLYPPF